MTRIFYDSEFTGLHQRATLISVGLSSEEGKEFYAEFSDFDLSQVDEWIKDNVLVHTRWVRDLPPPEGAIHEQEGDVTRCYGETQFVRDKLAAWFTQFEAVEIWADCLAWDWVLFCELFGGAFSIPSNIFYMPCDLATLFKVKGFNPDSDREEFARIDTGTTAMKHNALWDAQVSKRCYERLTVLLSSPRP